MLTNPLGRTGKTIISQGEVTDLGDDGPSPENKPYVSPEGTTLPGGGGLEKPPPAPAPQNRWLWVGLAVLAVMLLAD